MQAIIPDTLNLAERAKLAINALVSLRDESLGGQIYFYIRFYEDPPTAYHAPWDYGDGTGRYMDSLALAHIMTGSTEALKVAEELGELLLSWQDETGLLWWPQVPWTIPGPASTGLWKYVEEPYPQGPVSEVAFSPRGALMGLTTMYLLTGNERYRDSAQRLVNGLDEIALHKEDYRFLPELVYSSEGWRHTGESRADGTSELKSSANISALLRFHQATGDERSLSLAGGFLRFILHRAEGYEPDGSFFKTHGHWNHFHTKSEVITSAILYGLIAGEPEYLEWGRKAYDAAKSWGTDFGWYPEDLCIHQCCETCCTTIMLESALLLGLHVDPEYFSDAERYGRNHLVESQFVDIDWLARIPRLVPEEISETNPPSRTNNHDIARRSIGSFAGFSAPNDLFGIPEDPKWKDVRFKLMQCCSGAGTRGLYDLWHYATDDDGERARVHMFFSRPTSWADIVSYAPYEGRLEIRMKAGRTLGIRVPGWADHSELDVRVNGLSVNSNLDNHYLWLRDLQCDDIVTFHYDLPSTTADYTLGKDQYSVRFKGDTVIGITPPGKYCPLYQRDYYSQSEAPLKGQLWHLPGREIAPL